jgi:hypothetical protein
MSDYLPPHDAAKRAAQHLGQAIDLIEQFGLGAEGAYRVAIGGAPFVFKYWSGERANGLRLDAAVAAREVLQRCGWPLPGLHFWHRAPNFAFVVEAQMGGSRVAGVSVALCHRLLSLLAAVPPGAGSMNANIDVWLSALERSLYDDLRTSACHPLFLQSSPIGRRFVARAQATFAAARPALAAARDVIHGDFSAGNILCNDSGALTAVLDWQHGCVGHRGFDLIGLEWDVALRLNVGSAPALALVTARVDESVEETVRAFCRAYYGVWNLSWALDTADEETVLRAAVVVGAV